MQIGLKLWSINTDFYYEEAKKLYNQGYFDYIELYVVPNTVDTLAKWKRLDIPFILHAPHTAHGLNLANKLKRNENTIIVEQVKQFTEKLNALYTIFHGGLDGTTEELIFQFTQLNYPNALLENKPLIPLIKTKYKQCRGATLTELSQILAQCSCGFCLDFVHAICAANSQKINPYSYIENLLAFNPKVFHISNMSSHSSEQDEHFPLLSGELNIQELCNFLPQYAYITIETQHQNKYNLNNFITESTFFKNQLRKIQ